MSKSWDFSGLAPREQVFTGPDNTKYVLRGATADAAVRFHNANLNARQIDEDGKLVAWKGLVDSEPLLVSLCTFFADKDGKAIRNDDGSYRNLSENAIRQWPIEVMKQTYDWIVENSPGLLSSQTKESLEEEKAKIEKRLVKIAQEEANDPKALQKPSVASST